MPDKQVDIRSASFRVLYSTSMHVTYGVWINGASCGDLIVMQEERIAFQEMMGRGGFELRVLGPMGVPGERPMHDPHSGEAVERD